ncbi:MAG: DUF1847 domain-containing protein [Thermoplasmata archaeon]|jgi:uncharacterized metal-binding protein|nr:DUF1847 domain-containing protein [Thermoplasmata archaeon]
MRADCAHCVEKDCYQGKDCFGLADRAKAAYDGPELRSMRASGRIEAEHYMKKTRLEEVAIYAKEMGMRRIGIAFCVGLSSEAEVVADVLSKQGFEVHSVCCKVCGIDKSELGVARLHGEGGREAVCDPVGQAMCLAGCGTEMNLVVGLCVGHDMLFTKHSEAPVSTLIVKDRVLAHNPAGAIYSGYYRKNVFGLPPG